MKKFVTSYNIAKTLAEAKLPKAVGRIARKLVIADLKSGELCSTKKRGPRSILMDRITTEEPSVEHHCRLRRLTAQSSSPSTHSPACLLETYI
uniref:Uncharacterized protein n=1 Tax=Caenorhabditis japonica TaxID=281687 RepID=A0A8R1ETM2_CAEJA